MIYTAEMYPYMYALWLVGQVAHHVLPALLMIRLHQATHPVLIQLVAHEVRG
jgi:hypothetical protein